MKDSFDPGIEDWDNSESKTDMMDDGTKKVTVVKSLLYSTERFLWFFVLLLYLETVFHVWSFKSIDIHYFVKAAMCLPTAAFLSLFTCFFKEKVNKIVNWVVTGIVILYYVVNILYHAIFKVFFSVFFISKNNAKVAQYYREIMVGIKDNWLVIVLTVFIPVGLGILVNRLKVMKYKKASIQHVYVPITILALSIVIEAFVILAYGKDTFSPYDLCVNENLIEFSFEKLGVISTAEVELKYKLFPESKTHDDDLGDVWTYSPDDTPDPEPVSDVSQNDVSAGETEVSEPEPDPEPVVDRSPNMLDLDFVAMAENEPNEFIAGIDNYMSTLAPTKKNEYTGMFEGFNLIFMTAEGFSSIAVDEELTPTLYRLTHEGFVFVPEVRRVTVNSYVRQAFIRCLAELRTLRR